MKTSPRWDIWLMIHGAERTVISDLGFKGRPDREGTVEIGYSNELVPALPNYREESIRILQNESGLLDKCVDCVVYYACGIDTWHDVCCPGAFAWRW
jgi:hypothetical protein